ncbi:SDR family oxidoreductase [Legionella waltersii]|uniref:3-oxoacyl-ACP reductase n=1 Tax=Legionella waltersii TaxID=66969 RepID=A0A0W1ALQ0_9GAMM|nr:SDR family oxidoreductase [Legionella waltersii]KTD82268.1 3-oxoacyl-ACP reductase [Legionella waltersii]SNV04380.1 3-oxoacyl-ACP reductase [Legionella waltersii]
MKKRTALITGAEKGIGLAISRRLSNLHYDVIGIDLGIQPREYPGRLYQTNLSNLHDAESCFSSILKNHEIDILINNVGISIAQKITEIDFNDFDKVFNLNVKIAALAAKLIAPGMIKKNWGRIVNISSIRAFGGKDTSTYGASKAALIGCTLNWAVELAPHGITVNCVAPGAIDTEMFRKNYPQGSQLETDFLKHIPMSRVGNQEDIASAVEYLASENAGYITGQVLVIDGGLTLISV